MNPILAFMSEQTTPQGLCCVSISIIIAGVLIAWAIRSKKKE
jgi:hypothetical protein